MKSSWLIEGGDGPLRVVVAGGGVAALEATLALHELAGDRVHVELLAPGRQFTYRPLLVAEPFGLAQPRRVELDELARHAHAAHRTVTVIAVDPDAKTVRTSAGDDIAYDALLVAVGTRARDAVPGALTFPSRDFRALLDELESGAVQRLAFVVPAAATWSLPIYELALLTADRIERGGWPPVALSVVTHEAAPLALFGPEASDRVGELLDVAGVELIPDTSVTSFEGRGLHSAAGATIAADRVVALPRLEVPRLPGIPQGDGGFIDFGAHCEIVGVPEAFAAGDATAFPVKQGGIAAQQADVAAAAIARLAGVDAPDEPFAPVLRAAVLTGRAPEYVRAGVDGRTEVAGGPLWWPPGKIAARHLAPYIARRAQDASLSQPLVDLDAYRAQDPGAADAGNREALALALEFADAEAGWHEYRSALEWLDVAEQLNIVLPTDYVDRRRRWREAAERH